VPENGNFVPRVGTNRRQRPIRIGGPSAVELERDEGAPPSPVDALFTNTQRRVLGCLYGDPTREVHLRELLARTGAGHGAVQREVRRLVAAGLVQVRREGNRRLLQANPHSPIHAELAALVQKTVGLAGPLRVAFSRAQAHVLACFAFEPERIFPTERGLGVVAVVPDHPAPRAALDYGRDLAEKALHRPVWVMTPDLQRLRTDPYLAAVLRRPRVWIFGSEKWLASL